MLSRLLGCGLLPDDPRIQEALAGLTATEGASKQISFGQFKALANSVRGIEFCRKLVAAYNVHVFDSLVTGPGRSAKRDPRRKKNQSRIEGVVALTWAASQGDLTEVRALVGAGVEPGTADYDGRTALHLAAAEGQPGVVSYLLALGADPQPQDRWGGTPLSDAEGNGHTQVAELLRQAVRDTPEAVAV